MNARALILAAGFGSRLGELGKSRPKPMLPVCGAPLVSWVIRSLARYGIEDFVVNLHHHGEQIEAALQDGAALGVKIRYSKEDPIQGTGGALVQARSMLCPGDDVPIVIANGKLIHNIDISALLARHRLHGREATMVMRRDIEGIWGSALSMNPQALRLTELLDQKSPDYRPEDPRVMFCGVHVVSPSLIDKIPREGAPCIVRTAYQALFQEQGFVDAIEHQGYWWEHSTPQRYLQGVHNVLAGKVDRSLAPGPTRWQDPSAQVDSTAVVDPASWIGTKVRVQAHAQVGPCCQILEGAEIGEYARLRNCVVLEGAQVTGTHQDQVLSGQVSGQSG